MIGKLQLSFLGTPEISLEGRANSSFIYRKSLALLCYLAVTGKPHSRAALAGLLWGNATESNARAALRKSLKDLRKVAGEHLLISRHEVTFNTSASYWLDVDCFQQVERYVAENQDPEKFPTLLEAVSLYRGDFMAGFHIQRAPQFEEWVLFQRERLRLKALHFFYTLSIYFQTQANYSQAIHFAEKTLSLEPCHERAHRLLMSLLALSGQQKAALRQYQICCQNLLEELDLEPQEETTALYKRIRSDTGSTAALRPQLQRPVLPLIGRRKELASILAKLRDPHCRLLTLVGPGGSGKTHLAQEIVTRIFAEAGESDGDAENVFLISLAASTSMESVSATLAHGTRYQFSQESDPRRQLLSHLKRQNGFLVLDACEGLLELYQSGFGSFGELVEDILNIAPGITILATSRARLNLSCEMLFPLTGLEYPKTLPTNPNDLYRFEAVQLFLWRMRRVRPDFEPAAEDLIAVAEICRLVKGMPFEILLVANWAEMQCPAAIAAQLTSEQEQPRFSIRSQQRGQIDEQASISRDLKHSLTPIFDRSWKLLTHNEQDTLVALSVFPDGFTFETAHEITGLTMRGLSTLADQSLLNRSENPTAAYSTGYEPARYVMHDLLIKYLQEKTVFKAALDDARNKHCLHFMEGLNSWADALLDSREIETLRKMDTEIVSCRAAWDWAASRGYYDLLERGVDGLCRYYRLRNRYAEGESACNTAVRALSRSMPSQRLLLAKLQSWQAWFTPDREQAIELLDDSLKIVRIAAACGVDVRAERALALLVMSLHLLKTDHERSKDFFEQTLEIYRQIGDHWHAAFILGNLHIQHWKSGEYERGRVIAEECLDLYQKVGYLSGYAGVLGDMGIGEMQAGMLEQGMASIEESVRIFEQLGNRTAVIKGLYMRSMALAFSGKWDEADKQLLNCISTGASQCVFYDSVLISAAIVKTHLGQYERASTLAHAGLDLAKDLENQMCVGRALTTLALTAIAEGDPEMADKLADEAVKVYMDFGQKTELGLAFAARGFAECQLGNVLDAQAHFNEALNLASNFKDQLSLNYGFLGITYLLSLSGQMEQAIENYTLASQHPFIANSCWFDDIVKKQIDKVAATLPPEAVDAAIQRGRAHDLEAISKTLMSQ